MKYAMPVKTGNPDSNSSMDYYVFIDVESDGIYGNFLSVAMVATDSKLNELDRLYCGIRKDLINVTNPWVIENVLPIMGEYEPCENEAELLNRAWEFWKQYSASAYMVADVPFPVESRFLVKCMEINDGDISLSPFPLLDLCSMLYANGFDPLAERRTISGDTDLTMHNPLVDVQITINIFKTLRG